MPRIASAPDRDLRASVATGGAAARDLVSVSANRCLDVVDNNPANATPTQIWACTGGANQKWTVPA
ncbi:RICIN domain-containing protein [Micromonospora sp. NPDC023633]|uniref:RICIN domain-containing protein n=1 Tax=Micromonospora sp. NPDC023633 TaxID=3154320 RepID=UPI0033D755E4